MEKKKIDVASCLDCPLCSRLIRLTNTALLKRENRMEKKKIDVASCLDCPWCWLGDHNGNIVNVNFESSKLSIEG
ncbi:MAG: hypothetical protein B6I31_04465 [Desulfobacteraceae bacterium 4572_19]|nr:MAG: hypothetical protein B6I31_04465 [Desulfobacteraceae bacterium 4572_19]